MLIIPAAKSVKTKFNDVDYIRIGSSKEKFKEIKRKKHDQKSWSK